MQNFQSGLEQVEYETIVLCVMKTGSTYGVFSIEKDTAIVLGDVELAGESGVVQLGNFNTFGMATMRVPLNSEFKVCTAIEADAIQDQINEKETNQILSLAF